MNSHCEQGVTTGCVCDAEYVTDSEGNCVLGNLVSDWSEWSDCSASCGYGFRERDRSCLSSDCIEDMMQTEECSVRQCFDEDGNPLLPFPCALCSFCPDAATNNEQPELPMISSWSEWSGCSVTCGEGIRERNRVCFDPNCSEDTLETEECFAEQCFDDSGFPLLPFPCNFCNLCPSTPLPTRETEQTELAIDTDCHATGYQGHWMDCPAEDSVPLLPFPCQFCSLCPAPDVMEASQSSSVARRCPQKGTLVSWKGNRFVKITSDQDGRAVLRINIPDNAADFDILHNRYIGFMGFGRRRCGQNLLDAFFDETISWKIYDLGDYYTEQFMHKRFDGRDSSVVLQFFRLKFW